MRSLPFSMVHDPGFMSSSLGAERGSDRTEQDVLVEWLLQELDRPRREGPRAHGFKPLGACEDDGQGNSSVTSFR